MQRAILSLVLASGLVSAKLAVDYASYISGQTALTEQVID